MLCWLQRIKRQVLLNTSLNPVSMQVAAANRERKKLKQAEQGRRHADAAARHEAHVLEKINKAASENEKVVML